MKHKEDIGKLINEKLNQVQKSPSDDLWNKINTTLDKKKKKRRGFFIWFTAIGLLTLLSILYFGTKIFNSNEIINTNNEIVNQESSNSNLKDNKSNKQTEESNQTIIESNETDNIKTLTNESSSNNNSINNSSEEVVNKQDDNLKAGKKIQKTTSKISTDNNIKTVSNNNSTEKYSNDSNNKVVVSKKNTSEDSINSDTLSDKNKPEDNSSNAVSEKSSDINNTTPETALEKRLSERQKRKDSIIKIREKRKDSIAELRKPTEEKIEKTEEAEKKDSISENKGLKLNVTLIAAPQYSAVTKSGSMINSQLEGLDTKGAFNFNYGASVNFVGVKRMYSIGVLKTSINYQTLDVPILDPIYENIGGEMLLVYPESILDFGTLDKDASVSNSILEDFKNDDDTIDLVQKIEYIEVPLQYTYFISDNRFGLQVYGGISGYFLTSNALIAENKLGETLSIGEANNLSKISLSVNAGAGIYYHISKRFTAELNPTFKFLYKPTTTQSTKGSVLLFGIYTGIRMNLFSNKK